MKENRRHLFPYFKFDFLILHEALQRRGVSGRSFIQGVLLACQAVIEIFLEYLDLLLERLASLK